MSCSEAKKEDRINFPSEFIQSATLARNDAKKNEGGDTSARSKSGRIRDMRTAETGKERRTEEEKGKGERSAIKRDAEKSSLTLIDSIAHV